MSSSDQKPVKIRLAPGLKRQSTQYAAEGSWYDSDKVRFRTGRPESIRGWLVKSSSFVGKARDLVTWQDLEFNPLAALGTECKLYVFKGGGLYDVTPVITSAPVSISTSIGSTIVHVEGPNSDIGIGDYVVLTSANVGGLVVSGEYTAVSVASGSMFTILNSNAASGDASTGVTADFLLHCGTSSASYTTGYGTGPYGTGSYGVGTSGTHLEQARTWSLDTWGEDLLANPRAGKIYLWDASQGTSFRATEVSAAPSIVNFVVVAQQNRHVLALGATDEITGVFNPLLVRWCSQEDLDDWTSSALNTAGSLEVKGGTVLVGGVNTRNGTAIMTDDAAFFVTYIGPPFTFSFAELGNGIGLIAPNAAVDLNGICYWMSKNGWFKFDGQVVPLPDDIQKDTYDNLNMQQAYKIFGGTCKENGEVIWLLPSADSEEIDRYVLFDTDQSVWTWGTIDWTAWSDAGIFPNVLTTKASDSRIYDNDLPDYYEANGSPLSSWIESGSFDLDDGGKLLYSDKLIPDFEFSGDAGYVDLYLKFKKYPNAPEIVKGPYRVNTGTQFVSPRGRGRTAALIVACSAGTELWRMGDNRLFVKEDGDQ